LRTAGYRSGRRRLEDEQELSPSVKEVEHVTISAAETTLEPQELDFLQSCFDVLRRERGLEGDALTDRRAADNLAAEIIELYRTGVRDPVELTSRLA
jgi:hypothetical protein